jgi:hypothetical protein
MPGRRHGKSIKWARVYDALRRKGYPKSKSAAISNAMWNHRHGRFGKNIG